MQRLGFLKSKSQKGSALMQALLVVIAGSFATSIIMLQNQNHNQEHNLEKIKMKRDEVARRIATALTNPNFIGASTAKNILEPGNQMLRKCLGYDFSSDPTQQNRTILPPECDPTKEVPFLLVPADNYQFPADKKNHKNCPNPSNEPNSRHISCFLAGKKSGEAVAYNLKGESGVFGKEFPFQAFVYFQPVCISQDTGSVEEQKAKCHLAKSVKFRYELVHTGKDKQGLLGRYPVKPQWIEVHSSKIVGKECNLGAKVFATEKSGELECRCQIPYDILESSPGVPAMNARGVVCKLREKSCPRGLIVAGHKPNGDSICQSPNRGSYSFMKAIKSTDLQQVSCEYEGIGSKQKQVGGWISKMNIYCKTHLEFKEEEGAGFDATKVIIGAAIGGGVGLLVALLFMGPMGGALLILGLMGGGAIIGALLGMGYDWHLEPHSNTQCAVDVDHDNAPIYCPDIECKYIIECRAFKD